MHFSKYNIFSRIRNSENYFLVNILTGSADILSKEKASEIISGSYTDVEEYIEKGYLIEEVKEKELYNSRYLDFIDEREKDEIQIFFVPWYACNFSCSYCYQSGYENNPGRLTKEVIDAFFRYVNNRFAGRRKYITVFGGEPLLPSKAAMETMEYFLEKASGMNLETAVVTNGYTLSEYMEIFRGRKIREIQVTLDGTSEAHDKRRFLKSGGPTFEKIVQGIDSALNEKITVNLRMVLDAENMEALPGLAAFAVEKGWTKSPLFKTQLGRNYELHYCQTAQNKLLSRVEFYESIYNLVIKHPEIAEFHKPAFSISRFLFENGELPMPLFDSCPGCKTEWAFDYTGNIYSCTATVGKPGESLGTFYPEVTGKTDIIEHWEERDVTVIPECKDCSLQLACGGGCAAVAFNRTGELHSPDCRPIKELLEMGLSLYFEQETT